ncbi:MAG: peptidylprolyl isomerase [Deltaproteobacteria bacterium]|nr:peptidylprolyl isomerase [Deltaproteobacteria bacterium]
MKGIGRQIKSWSFLERKSAAIVSFTLLLSAFYAVLLSFPLRAEIVDRIIAIVGKEIVTSSDLADFKKRVAGGEYFTETEGEKKDLLASPSLLLDRLIEERIVLQEIKKKGLGLSEEDLEKEINFIQQQNKIDRQTLIQALEKERISFEKYKAGLKRQIEQRQLVEKEIKSKINITDEDIAAYYEQHMSREKEFHLRQILIAVKEGDDENAAFKKAQDLLAQIQKGGSFAQLAKEHSDDPYAPQGGDLGYLKASDLLPVLQKGVEKMKIGEVSEILRSHLGFHMIKVEDIRAKGIEHFSKIKENIRLQLFQLRLKNAIQIWIDQKKRGYFIKKL